MQLKNILYEIPLKSRILTFELVRKLKEDIFRALKKQGFEVFDGFGDGEGQGYSIHAKDREIVGYLSFCGTRVSIIKSSQQSKLEEFCKKYEGPKL